MRTQFAVVCVVLLCTCFGGSALAQDKPMGTPLSGAEMKALYDNGVVLDWMNLGNKGSTGLLGGGNAIFLFVASGGTGTTDKGRWRIDGDSICLKWEFINHGEEYCVRHYSLGGTRYEARNQDGTLRGPFTLRK